MCGIAGILNLSGPRPISVETLKKRAGILSSQVIFRQFVTGFPYHPSDSLEPVLFFDRRSRAAA